MRNSIRSLFLFCISFFLLMNVAYAEGLLFKSIGNDITITGYDGVVENLVIPEKIDGKKVTAIEMKAFEDNYDLVSVAFPNTLKTIGMRAFYGCVNLEEVTIPDSVTRIEGYAFAKNDRLEKVTMSNNIKTIQSCAFADCIALGSIELPASLKELGPLAFANCESIKSVHLSTSMSVLKNSVFSRCKSLTAVVIPESVTTIEQYAFSSSGIEAIVIPSSVIEIDSTAFSNTHLKTVYCVPGTMGEYWSNSYGDVEVKEIGEYNENDLMAKSIETADISSPVVDNVEETKREPLEYELRFQNIPWNITYKKFKKTSDYGNDENWGRTVDCVRNTLDDFLACPEPAMSTAAGEYVPKSEGQNHWFSDNEMYLEGMPIRLIGYSFCPVPVNGELSNKDDTVLISVALCFKWLEDPSEREKLFSDLKQVAIATYGNPHGSRTVTYKDYSAEVLSWYGVNDTGVHVSISNYGYAYLLYTSGQYDEYTSAALQVSEGNIIKQTMSLTGEITNSSTTNSSSEESAVCTANQVNIRKEPSMKSGSVGQINKGDKLTVVETQGEWSKINSSKGNGWIKTQYIKK